MSKRCFNHPEKQALSLCHSCKKYYCEDCLTAGNKYYYCKNNKCQSLLNEEKARINQEKSARINDLKISNKIFFKRVFSFLIIAWLLISIFLYATLERMEIYYFPIFSLIICLQWFIIIWIARLIWCKYKYKKV